MHHVDELSINTLRFLAVDAVEQANSGHPGLPLGAAPMAYVLWKRLLRHSPSNPAWFNRDRFVLSAGHGSALLYALLHVFGYDLSLDELKRFRQWESKTPGHPEHGLTAGIEATTGPLGQGFAMGVGMAIAEAHLAQKINKTGFPIVDHFTYGIVSDGDLMEGVSSEAASLAGTLGLGKLIYLYDDNHISIEGDTNLAFTENVLARFDAYGWHTQTVSDGNDLDSIESAIRTAQSVDDRPSLIAIRTHIGFGSPRQGKASAHGEPLGAKGVEETKSKLGWPLTPAFFVPQEVGEVRNSTLQNGVKVEAKWDALVARYAQEYPELGALLQRTIKGELPADVATVFPRFEADKKGMATRAASGKVMNAIAESIPELMGGSADLAPSTKTALTKFADFSREDRSGRNMHFGIREFAMGAIVNGMALHGGTIPYGSTFLVFSDYMRPALRLAALMQTHAVFVFTHDSIGVGEDGPTHQPIEHIMSLRMIPGLTVLRPADANETSAAWQIAIEKQGPVVMALSRQNLPTLADSAKTFDGSTKGAYVIDSDANPEVVLIGTGSEVHVAVAAAEKLRGTGVRVQIVSMPCWELFDSQSDEYREAVLPRGIPKVAIEAGVSLGWQKYTGHDGAVIGIDRFGASAPGDKLMGEFGFNVENVCAIVSAVLPRNAHAAKNVI
ncbi:MAG TPA: transketolase [Clostridia bacterium]|nr:transketolase [Clostridia bacterium]